QSRRILRLYGFTPPAQVTTLAQEFQEAATDIINAPFRRDLDPLDRADEFIVWYGPPPPDFPPMLNTRGLCATRRSAVGMPPDFQRLIKLIQGPRGGGRGGVPDRMAGAFIGMYQAQLNQYQNQQPPPQALIDSLQQKIQQLQQFRSTLN